MYKFCDLWLVELELLSWNDSLLLLIMLISKIIYASHPLFLSNFLWRELKEQGIPVDDHQSSTAPDPEADSELLYLQLKTYASIMEKACMIQSTSLPLRIFALATGYWIQLAMLQCLTIHDYTIYRHPNNSRMLVIDSKCPFGDTNAVKKMLTVGFTATDGAQSDVIIVPEGTDLVSV